MNKTPDCYLTIDVGTSSLKATLFDIDGNMLDREVMPYAYRIPYPNWAEQNPLEWWEACSKACRKLMTDGQQHVLAVCVSGQGPGCVPVNHDGMPVRPAILWLDRRSKAQAAWLELQIDHERIPSVRYNIMDSYFGGVKWLWYIQHEPENDAMTWKILQANGFIVLKLTGEAVTDPSHAGICSPYFDLKTGNWSDVICLQTGLDREKLPDILPSSQVVGTVTKTAASQTGLPLGVPVVCGAPDFICSHLGSGAAAPGVASLMLGTAGNLMAITHGETDTRMLNTPYLTGELISTGGVLAGAAVSWFGELVNGTGSDGYETLDREAAVVEQGAGNLVFLPHLVGGRSPIWDTDARGVYFGLSANHQRGHLYRAVLEGVAYGFRQLVDIFSERGTDIQEIAVSNGGAQSALWRQILADVLDVPLRWRPKKDSTSLGGGFLAALGVKAMSDPREITAWLEPAIDIRPKHQNNRRYEHLYQVYVELYDRLKDLFPKLHYPAE